MKKTLKPLALALLILLLIPCSIVEAQTKVVNGYVSTLDGLSVGNIEITAKKSKSSVTSKPDGTFSIVCNNKDVLTFKGKVFSDKTVKIKKNTTDINTVLEFIQTPENIEIAIGYGYVSDANKLNAAAKASSEEGFCNYSDILDLIRSQFPGVIINSNCVMLRGISSVTSSSCAMYVVDGQNVSSISHIVPCDVKSIDILKDGGSAIYGAQGANGVIIITLK